MKQESSYVKQENASSQLCCFRLALCLPCGSFIIPEIARTVHKQTFTDDWGSEKNYRNIVNILALLHDIWRKESVVCIKDLFNAHYGVIKPSVHCVLFKEVPLRDLCVHVQVLRWLICFQMKLYSCKKKKKGSDSESMQNFTIILYYISLQGGSYSVKLIILLILKLQTDLKMEWMRGIWEQIRGRALRSFPLTSLIPLA